MAIYRYIAIDADSQTLRGILAADRPPEARQTLRDRGLTVLDITDRGDRRSKQSVHFANQLLTSLKIKLQSRAYSHQTLDLIRELSTLLAVGLPMLEAIDTLLEQQNNKQKTKPRKFLSFFASLRKTNKFNGILLSLRDQVASGLSLAEAMREHPEAFDDICVCMTEVGQDSGQLDSTLQQLSEYREHASQLKDRVIGALLYPIIVLAMGLGVCIFLMTYVVPSLLESLVEADKSLPQVTLLVKSISDFLIYQWPWLMLASMICVSTFLTIISLPRGRILWHHFLLRIPLLGLLLRKQAISRMAVVLATLLQSGVVFLQAIEVAARVTNNLTIRRALERSQQQIQAGEDIGPAIGQSGQFPATVVQIFSIGQKSGNLESMLERLAKDYDRQVVTAVTRLTAVLEPLLIVLLAVLVGIIAFATILPILEAGNVL